MSSSYPLVHFVDGPSVGATVRLDLNDQTAPAPRNVQSDFDLGSPTLQGDPDAVGQVFGFRSPRFTVKVNGTKANALAFVSALSKEMLRRSNWVLFQLNATTSPVWFKTYRTGYESLSLEQVFVRTSDGGNVAVKDTWKVAVPLVAEAFAYGARVIIPTAQIVQAPADLTGPARGAMRMVLPALKGDAPTRLRVTLTPSSTGNNVNVGCSWLVGCVAGTSAMADPVVDIGSGDTVGNISGTAAPSTDATYFGGSYRTVTIAAATPNLLHRFSMSIPTTTPRGRYKLLLRARFTAGAAKTLLFRLRQLPGGSTTGQSIGLSKTVTTLVADTGRDFWVDMGEVAFPMGTNPPSNVAGNAAQIGIGVDIGTADGSASSVNVDSVKLIPIDGPEVTRAALMTTTSPGLYPFASLNVVGNLDGDDEVGWSWIPSLSGFAETALTLRGAFPVADPAAAQNVLLVMALDPGPGAASGTSYITALNAQAAVDVSYYPRYLYVGDGT